MPKITTSPRTGVFLVGRFLPLARRPAGITAINNVVPVAFPLFSPRKRSIANRANFRRQVRLFPHFHTLKTPYRIDWF